MNNLFKTTMIDIGRAITSLLPTKTIAQQRPTLFYRSEDIIFSTTWHYYDRTERIMNHRTPERFPLAVPAGTGNALQRTKTIMQQRPVQSHVSEDVIFSVSWNY